MTKRKVVERPENSITLDMFTTPPSISIEEAAKIVNRKVPYLYAPMADGRLDWGTIDGVSGKRIIKNDKWLDFVSNCKNIDMRKETEE